MSRTTSPHPATHLLHAATTRAARLALATTLLAAPSYVHAADLYYLGAQYTPGPGLPAPWPTEGSWFDPNLWQNFTLPTSTTKAILGYGRAMPNTNTTHAPHILHFGNFGYFADTVIPGGTATVGTITIVSDAWTFDFGSGQNPDFTGILAPSTGSLSVSSLTLSGIGQSASLTLQNGSLAATGYRMGNYATGASLLELGDGATLKATTATIGIGAAATLSQTGGNHIVGTLSMGPSGVYQFSGGTLQISGGIENTGAIVVSGTTTFDVAGMVDLAQGILMNPGGISLTLQANSLLILPVGSSTASFGAFVNNGGIAVAAGSSITIPAGTLIAGGGGGAHEMILCSGTLTGSTNLYGGIRVLDPTANCTTYCLYVENPNSGITTGQLNVNTEYVGLSGTGVFTQTGGTHTISYLFSVGNNSGSTGSYALSSGQIIVNGINGEEIGRGGTGYFSQSGGSHSVSGTLRLGVGTNSKGVFFLSGGLLTTGFETIGPVGSGTFNQTGGTHTVLGTLGIEAKGLLSLMGGTLQVGSLTQAGSLVLGGTATLNSSGQLDLTRATLSDVSHFTINITSNAVLLLPYGNFGHINNPTGITFQYGGTTTIPSGTVVSLGAHNLYSTIYCAGTLSTTGTLSGAVQLQGATASVSFGTSITDIPNAGMTDGLLSVTNEYLGYYGSGTFSQTAGTHSVSGSLILGYNSGVGRKGTYTLNGGQLKVYQEFLGYSGSGSFNQTGGSHTLTSLSTGNQAGYLYLGYNAGASGSYALSGGQLTTGTEYVGYSGVGNFTQSGGTHTVSGTLAVGYNAGASGTLQVQSGTLVFQLLYAGRFGNAAGTIIQSGGLVTYRSATGNNSVLGFENTSAGLYAISDGTLQINDGFLIGGYGAGSFTQTGGTATFSGIISVGRFAGSKGFISVTGGTLVQEPTPMTVGEQGTGTLAISGTGVVKSLSPIYVNKNASGSTGTSTITLGPGGTLTTQGFILPASPVGAYFIFNGGTLGTNRDNAAFLYGFTSAKIQSGGAKIDTGMYSITISQRMQSDLTSPGGPLVKLGTGTLTLSATGSNIDGLQVASGNLSLQSSLLINGTSAPRGTPATALDIAAGGLTFGTSGSLDITNHDMLLRYSPGTGATALSTALSWLQSSKLKSTSLTTNQALVCFNNAALAKPFTTFDGIALADANQILIKYTWKGDANLDGKINFNDYLALDAGYLFGGTDWTHGDFTGDGQVTLADYVAIDAAFLAQNQVLASDMIALHADQFGPAYTEALASAIPEPASLALLALATPLLLTRRKSAFPPHAAPSLAPHQDPGLNVPRVRSPADSTE